MKHVYNEKYYNGKTLKQLSPKMEALQTFLTPDGVVVAMFQGKKGQFPHLDFKIKILRPGELEVPEPPPHTYWVVDLMLKIEKYREEVKEIIEYYIKFYNSCKPFDSVKERNSYKLQTIDYITTKYKHIEQSGTLSLNYIAIILELFSLCEKRNEGAWMFKNLLNTFLDYIERKVDYMKLLHYIEKPY